jgi:hypothetical protein
MTEGGRQITGATGLRRDLGHDIALKVLVNLDPELLG